MLGLHDTHVLAPATAPFDTSWDRWAAGIQVPLQLSQR